MSALPVPRKGEKYLSSVCLWIGGKLTETRLFSASHIVRSRLWAIELGSTTFFHESHLLI
jgi:hypothetical protein